MTTLKAAEQRMRITVMSRDFRLRILDGQ
jgi:hypothetical protein